MVAYGVHPLMHSCAYQNGDKQMETAVNEFVQKYIAKPKGSSSPVENVIHWISVANDPAQFHPQADAFELRYRRRLARQNVRRLLAKHPALVATVAKLMEGTAKDQDAATVAEVRNAT